jgi:hypothetical protein
VLGMDAGGHHTCRGQRSAGEYETGAAISRQPPAECAWGAITREWELSGERTTVEDSSPTAGGPPGWAGCGTAGRDLTREAQVDTDSQRTPLRYSLLAPMPGEIQDLPSCLGTGNAITKSLTAYGLARLATHAGIDDVGACPDQSACG